MQPLPDNRFFDTSSKDDLLGPMKTSPWPRKRLCNLNATALASKKVKQQIVKRDKGNLKATPPPEKMGGQKNKDGNVGKGSSFISNFEKYSLLQFEDVVMDSEKATRSLLKKQLHIIGFTGIPGINFNIKTTLTGAHALVTMLTKDDKGFIKRSSGFFTYAYVCGITDGVFTFILRSDGSKVKKILEPQIISRNTFVYLSQRTNQRIKMSWIQL
jgi:hypothetical protein